MTTKQSKAEELHAPDLTAQERHHSEQSRLPAGHQQKIDPNRTAQHGTIPPKDRAKK